MKRRALVPADSLELLLDTMCNTFGGIILIALLVALLSRTGGPSEEAPASHALYEQRIALAEGELEALRKEAGTWAASNNTAPLADVALAAEALAAARADAAVATTDATRRADAIAAGGGAAWAALAEELRTLARREAELQNLIAATEAETARLRERESALKAQVQRQREAQTVKLRFPKERARTRSSLPVICQHGRIYPIHTASHALDRVNIQWRTTGTDAEESTPLPERGLQMPSDANGWREVLRAMKAENIYVAFYVYPDSYEAFRAAKEMAIETRFEFGIEVVRAGRKLIWGSSGSSPPPL
jgi:hypothetical protein